MKEAGGEVSRGIDIDAGGRTTIPDVYAAGDCTESLDVASGTKKILALLPNASFQGRIAGVNMAGGEERLTDAAAFNSIGFFGTHVMTAGVYEGEEYLERTECFGGCVAGAGVNIPVEKGAAAVQKFVQDSTNKLPPKELYEIQLP